MVVYSLNSYSFGSPSTTPLHIGHSHFQSPSMFLYRCHLASRVLLPQCGQVISVIALFSIIREICVNLWSLFCFAVLHAVDLQYVREGRVAGEGFYGGGGKGVKGIPYLSMPFSKSATNPQCSLESDIIIGYSPR